MRDAVAHLGSYLFHELTTPLGLRLDRSRRLSSATGVTPFRSFGTYAVWFPRGLLLRLAARRACSRILEDWQAAKEPLDPSEVEAACARVLAEPDLRVETLSAEIEKAASTSLDASPAEALTSLLATLEEQSQQSIAQDDPGNWARQALARVREWLGSGHGTANENTDWKKSKLGKALGGATQLIAEVQEQRLATAAFGLMESPGHRIAAAEAALNRFVTYCDESADAVQAGLAQQSQKREQAWEQVQTALASCLAGTGGFSFFGGGCTRRLLRVFVDHLAAFARLCLAEDVATSVEQVFVILHGRLADQLRDLTFCRQRLRHLQEALEAPPEEEDGVPTPLQAGEVSLGASPLPSADSYWEAIRQSSTARVVLPDGEADLERASIRFLNSLNAEQWSQLDQALQENVLTHGGGLHRVCLSSVDLMRSLIRPLLEHASRFLGDHLPVTDVAEAEFSAAGTKQDVQEHLRSYFASAAPLVSTKGQNGQHAFLLVPASQAGKAYAEEAQAGTPDMELVRVSGQADLMFCREQDYLSPLDLQRLLRLCRKAYEETSILPQASPHARFDIADWIPLDS